MPILTGKLLLKDTTESHCIINLLNHGLMTGTGPFNQYDRLRAASKQIWWMSQQK